MEGKTNKLFKLIGERHGWDRLTTMREVFATKEALRFKTVLIAATFLSEMRPTIDPKKVKDRS